MRRMIPVLLMLALLISCENSPITGTWQLISVETIQGRDTTLNLYTEGVIGIKMFNDTHFSFFQHDLEQGADSSSSLFVSGGGTYFLENGWYKEHLEYCNFREYENNSFEFQLSIDGDTLVQRGKEEVAAAGVDIYITETYLKLD